MEVVSSVLNWFSSNILQNPAFFVGLLVLIGYALLKKPAHDVFSGFVKATVGYMLLNVGAGGLVTTFRPILAALNYKFQIGAAVIDPYFGLAAANNKIAAEFPDFVGTATTALLIGFGINILLVALRKITKVRNPLYYWSHHGTTSCNSISYGSILSTTIAQCLRYSSDWYHLWTLLGS